jgi:DNA-binding transcriptional ArsR family regulator
MIKEMSEIKNEEELTKVLKALANPIRLRIISHLSREPLNVYDLAKALKLSYPLTFLHVKTLKALGLVKEVKREESAKGLLPIKYYRASDFEVKLSSETIREIVEKGR